MTISASYELVINMENKNWNFTSSSDNAYYPVLHDCIAEKMELADGELRLSFPGGFKLLPDDPMNPYDEPHMTGPSELVFSLLYEDEDYDPAVLNQISLEVFHEHYLIPHVLYPPHRMRRPLFTTCVRPSFAKMAEKINSGEWKLWFISKYTLYDIGYLYECVLLTKHRTHRCYFSVECNKVRFYWNEVKETHER